MRTRALLVAVFALLGSERTAVLAQEPGGYSRTDMAENRRRARAERERSEAARVAAAPARASRSSMDEIRENINWALGEGHCAQFRCRTFVHVVQVEGVPVPVTRATTTAREMIFRAKAARTLGYDNLAFVMVFSTQLHNDDVLRLYNNNYDLVLRALDELDLGRDFGVRDYALAYLKSVVGIP